MADRSHYEVLGVPVSASESEIREAYRRLAREHHPDRRGAGGDGGSMHDINEAYRVLGDPGRRAMYDAARRSQLPGASRAEGPQGPAPAPPDVPPVPRRLDPPRVPWRMLTTVGVIAIAGVWILAQFTDPGEDPPVDGILRVGDCVALEANSDAREVRCTGTDDLVVRAVVPFDEDCPGSTEPHRDRQGMGIACIDRGPVATG